MPALFTVMGKRVMRTKEPLKKKPKKLFGRFRRFVKTKFVREKEPELNRILNKVYLRGANVKLDSLAFYTKGTKKKESGIFIYDWKGINDLVRGKKWLNHIDPADRRGNPKDIKNLVAHIFIQKPFYYFGAYTGEKGSLMVIDKKKLHKKLDKLGIDYELKPDKGAAWFGQFRIKSKKKTLKKIPIDEVGVNLWLSPEEEKRIESTQITKRLLYDVRRNWERGRWDDMEMMIHPLDKGRGKPETEIDAPFITRKEAMENGDELVKVKKHIYLRIIDHLKHRAMTKKVVRHLLKEYAE